MQDTDKITVTWDKPVSLNNRNYYLKKKITSYFT